jgi:hypothetical protein
LSKVKQNNWFDNCQNTFFVQELSFISFISSRALRLERLLPAITTDIPLWEMAYAWGYNAPCRVMRVCDEKKNGCDFLMVSVQRGLRCSKQQ